MIFLAIGTIADAAGNPIQKAIMAKDMKKLMPAETIEPITMLAYLARILTVGFLPIGFDQITV